MAYYDIYIGDKPFKLYIEDQPFDINIEDGLPEGVWARLDTTYDPNTNLVMVTVKELSPIALRYKYQLRLEFEYKHGTVAWRNFSRTCGQLYERPSTYDTGRHAIKNTGREWIASSNLCKNFNPDLGYDRSTLSNQDTLIELNKKFSFSLKDLFSGQPYGENGNPRKGYHRYEQLQTKYYLDTRFYIYNTYTNRFVKTISPVLRLIYQEA